MDHYRGVQRHGMSWCLRVLAMVGHKVFIVGGFPTAETAARRSGAAATTGLAQHAGVEDPLWP
jgi:hypothetical protein